MRILKTSPMTIAGIGRGFACLSSYRSVSNNLGYTYNRCSDIVIITSDFHNKVSSMSKPDSNSHQGQIPRFVSV